MKKFLIFSCFLLVIASCVYPFDPVSNEEPRDIAVFEGSIIIGGVSTVKVSKAWSLSRSSSGVKSAVAWVEDDAGNRYEPFPTSVKDNLIKIHTESATADRQYRMLAEVDGKKYSSDWMRPLAPPVIESVDITPTEGGDNLEVLVTLKGGEESTGYVGIYFDETWEFHADHIGWYDLDTLKWTVNKRNEPYPNYWCWKSNSSTMKILDHSEYEGGRVSSYPLQLFSRSDDRNHKKYSINVKAITLPNETYRYIKNLGDISNGTGSLFSPNPGEMTCNVSCESDPSAKVFGYVTVSLEASKRTFIDNKYYVEVPAPQWYLFLPSNGPIPFMSSYNQGNYPVDFLEMNVDGMPVMGVFWGPLRCIDCVVAGGTKQKPDFWDNE